MDDNGKNYFSFVREIIDRETEYLRLHLHFLERVDQSLDVNKSTRSREKSREVMEQPSYVGT